MKIKNLNRRKKRLNSQKKKLNGKSKRNLKNKKERKKQVLTKKESAKHCSPSATKEQKLSCLNKNSLLKISNSWNKNNPGNTIKINENDSIRKLWNKINNKLKNKCQSEWCWIQQEFIKNMNDKEIIESFRPKMPRKWLENKNEWLSTTDIENVMKQYEKIHKNFLFIGPVPIDFDSKDNFGTCIVNELCKLNINNLLQKNINKIGIIFNLDKHDQSGSHWVALFIDLENNNIYYFDSYGEPAPDEVNILSQRLIEQGKKYNRNIVYTQNKVRHQYENSECGVYCIHFVVKLLKGHSFKDITENKINDMNMNKNRWFFYSPSKPI